MNASEIWSGQDYAYVDFISRGVGFYSNARPVRILHKFKQKTYNSERGRTMCEVIMLRENDDGKLEPKLMSDGTEYITTVRARNIYAHWEEHARERNNRKIKQAEIDRERAIERERREREYTERMERERIAREHRQKHEEAERERFYNYLEFKGIPRELVSQINDGYVSLDRKKLEELVGFTPRPLPELEATVNV